jgi:hypothetical protein
VAISIYCAAIALIAGLFGASPWRASLMGGGVAFVSGFIAITIERRFNEWTDIYLSTPLALMFAAAAAVMAFTVAKTKR